MTKRVDNAVYQVVETVVDGTFSGGINVFNAANDGVGYSDNAGNLTPELVEAADMYLAAIKDGTIMVPGTAAELEAFVAPEL